ncbi:hypothetical protein ARMGADRAFT_311162 [Armillaria gallica]|uniref:Uncharacterized protein n=1 Tax=Armillaria gallica TaxID=47427 RepID=A0A2H3D4S7_ARMGA|nr:hypothetical protein ARMGADRAFT_311162 [Armillaria gallica]
MSNTKNSKKQRVSVHQDTTFWTRADFDASVSLKLLAALRIAVTCTFVGCVITYIYWEDIRKFCRADLIKLLAALVFCALLTQLDIWPSIPDILNGLEGGFPRSILIGTRFIITSASRMMSIVMISHTTIMLWHFALYKPEILLLELVVHGSLHIDEAVLTWLIRRIDGL